LAPGFEFLNYIPEFQTISFIQFQMNSEQLIHTIRNYCIRNTNEANILKYSRYFKNGYDAYGLSQPQMDDGAKDMMKLPGINLDLVLEAAPSLLKTGKYEETGMILQLVRGMHKQYSLEVFQEIETWYAIGISNWAHADTLGMAILPLFLKKGILHTGDFESWLVSPYKFQRRCVPVTLIKSLKTQDDFMALFLFIERLMTDPDREVHQGTGWFLREAWKKKAPVTDEFLLKWKDSAPRLIIQYATEKMSPDQKLKFRKTKA
jgi:3-methyladenine DNA glycosylase AlkD